MAGSPSPRVLLTVDDYYASLAAVRGLRAGGYEPWVAAAQHGTYAGRSRATAGEAIGPDPGAGADAFVAFVAETAERLGIAAVLPCTERSLNALAGRHDAFPDGVVLAAPSPELLAQATDKLALARPAAAAGIRVPATVEAGAEELSDRRTELRFPAVVKPAQSTIRAGDGTVDLPDARLVESYEELESLLEARTQGRWLVQPYLTGELTAVAGVAWNGGLVCAGRQVSRRIYPPDCGASAFAESLPRDAELEGRIERLLGLLGWSGIFEVQFIRSQGEDYMIDFNPRVYGSLALVIAAGLNLPAIWADLLLGRTPRVGSYRAGIGFRAEERDARVVARMLAGRRYREALSALLPRRRAAHAVFSWRDPAPLLGLVAKLRNRRRRIARVVP